MTEKPLPGHAEQPKEIVCASCGHFVGALLRCPHCGARVEARMSVRLFRVAALFLAVVGLGLLYLMARGQAIPLVQVGQIKATMNFAYIRLAGKVTGEPRINWEGDRVRSVRFNLNDGTGEIPVMAFRVKGQELVDQDKVPRAGDHVDVSGSLSVSAESLALWVQAPEDMILERSEIPRVLLRDVGASPQGGSVLVEGTVARLTPPREGSRAPWTLLIRDETGEQEITIWQSILDEIKDPSLLKAGSRIRVYAAVASFRDQLQLRLSGPADITRIDSPAPPPGATEQPASKPATAGRDQAPALAEPASVRACRVGEVSPAMTGQWVSVEGRVDEVVPPAQPRAPYKIILADGQDRIHVVYWDQVAQDLKENTPQAGQFIRVRGQVNLFDQELRIKVEAPEQMTRVENSTEG